MKKREELGAGTCSQTPKGSCIPATMGWWDPEKRDPVRFAFSFPASWSPRKCPGRGHSVSDPLGHCPAGAVTLLGGCPSRWPLPAPQEVLAGAGPAGPGPSEVALCHSRWLSYTFTRPLPARPWTRLLGCEVWTRAAPLSSVLVWFVFVWPVFIFRVYKTSSRFSAADPWPFAFTRARFGSFQASAVSKMKKARGLGESTPYTAQVQVAC